MSDFEASKILKVLARWFLRTSEPSGITVINKFRLEFTDTA
jgi:hypothetical protein